MPTEVEFHTGVEAPLVFACRLLRKAFRKGARVLVTAPGAMLGRLDRELWTFDDKDFVPHVRWSGAGPTPAVAARTPIWLTDGEPPAGSPPILINLGADAVASPEHFDRIIEIVSTEIDEVQAGRQRWRAYKSLGLPLKNHGAGAGGG